MSTQRRPGENALVHHTLFFAYRGPGVGFDGTEWTFIICTAVRCSLLLFLNEEVGSPSYGPDGLHFGFRCILFFY